MVGTTCCGAAEDQAEMNGMLQVNSLNLGIKITGSTSKILSARATAFKTDSSIAEAENHWQK
jgi:hypothetical protein